MENKTQPDLDAIDRALDAPPNPLASEMTLRDHFAGQAVAGFIASHAGMQLPDQAMTAAYAGTVADAMLVERAKGRR